MSRAKTLTVLAFAAIAGLAIMSQVYSQDSKPPDSKPPDSGDRGARGGDRGGDFRQQMETRMKESLGCTDEEWKALQPKIEKVTTAQRSARGGMGMFGRGGRGNRPGDRGGDRGGDRPAAGGQPDRQPGEVEKKGEELRKVLDNKEAKPDDIKAALTAYRDARTKAREELAAAQKDLKDVVSVKQEAQLVMMGLLE